VPIKQCNMLGTYNFVDDVMVSCNRAYASNYWETRLELPPGMPGISPELVTIVPGTVVAKDIPARDTIIPG